MNERLAQQRLQDFLERAAGIDDAIIVTDNARFGALTLGDLRALLQVEPRYGSSEGYRIDPPEIFGEGLPSVYVSKDTNIEKFKKMGCRITPVANYRIWSDTSSMQ